MKYEFKTLVNIRHEVFKSVAKMAYEENFDHLINIPFDIIKGDIGNYRASAFLDRAIIAERLRLAMGLNIRPSDRARPITEGIELANKPEKYYEPPLINIIKFACDACPTNSYEVSNMCRGCLAHPCTEVCPVEAIKIVNNRAIIDQDKCIKCGLCAKACPYTAIQHHQRPCAQACGVDAISSDENGRAQIDYDKCVACGQCIVACPFGAISDKAQIYQLIHAINAGEDIIACVAPAFLGQFGKNVGFDDFKTALKKLGFKDAIEVAIGADICTIDEAHDFLEKVPDELDFLGTSCCPSWSVMAKNQFPEFKDNISMTLTPMVFSARLVRETNPNAKIVFIGPCSAKKLEASRRTVRSEVDFVITFEELSGMFAAKDVEVIGTNSAMDDQATGSGRGFAVTGGVAEAVANLVKKEHPEIEVKTFKADGLKDCVLMLKGAKKNKFKGYLLEGMACPGGCVAGAGCIAKPSLATGKVKVAAKTSKLKTSDESGYADKVHLLRKD